MGKAATSEIQLTEVIPGIRHRTPARGHSHRDRSGDGLPPGSVASHERAPRRAENAAAFQTTAWLTRHVPFLERCRRRYGDAFTLRFSTLDPLVFVSDPDSIKRLFSSDRENTLPPGRALTLEPLLGRARSCCWRGRSTCAAAS